MLFVRKNQVLFLPLLLSLIYIFILFQFPSKQNPTEPECELKYQLIKQVLDKYERRFDVLEIGANNGYHSFQIAKNYDALCVMIEANPSGTDDPLLKFCRSKNLDNLIYLNKALRIEDLKRLSECESFSVVLALNNLNWAGSNWKEAVDVVLSLGDNTVIEALSEELSAGPEENEKRCNINAYLQALGAKTMGTIPPSPTVISRDGKQMTSGATVNSSTLYFFEREKTNLQRKIWILNCNNMKNYRIKSDYRSRTLTKTIPEHNMCLSTPWISGINFLTFKMYHGIYPEKNHLKSELKKLAKTKHTDWMCNNIIVTGKKICLIDMDDPRHRRRAKSCSKKTLGTHLELVDVDSPENVEAFYLALIGHSHP
jgi:hypothetical protein